MLALHRAGVSTGSEDGAKEFQPRPVAPGRKVTLYLHCLSASLLAERSVGEAVNRLGLGGTVPSGRRRNPAVTLGSTPEVVGGAPTTARGSAGAPQPKLAPAGCGSGGIGGGSGCYGFVTMTVRTPLDDFSMTFRSNQPFWAPLPASGQPHRPRDSRWAPGPCRTGSGSATGPNFLPKG